MTGVEHFLDTITLAPDAQALAAHVLATCDELAAVAGAAPRILYLHSQRALFLHGGPKAAVIVQPRWQGPLGMVAEVLIAHLASGQFDLSLDPDYVVITDVAVWGSLDAEGRERLIFHELSHLQQVEDDFGVPRVHRDTGTPILRLMPHSYEVFDTEIRRYGIQTCGIEAIAPAIVEGDARARRRRFKVAS